MKKKTKSILAIVVAILLLIIVIVTLTINILFSSSDTPKIFGHYIYLMEWDTMEVNSEADTATSVSEATSSGTTEDDDSVSIHQYTAVIADEYDESDPIAKNNAVLCVLADDDTSTDIDSDRIAVRRIYNIEQDDSGVILYYPTTMVSSEIGTEPSITVDNILGKCTYESSELYSYITFSTGVAGILLLLVLPCVILVIMLITAIVRANGRTDDDEYAFEENYDEVYSEDSYDDYNEELGSTPLYRAGETNTNSNLSDRRSSVADNFAQKPVNMNSPYQKARTMQFKAQQDVPIYTNPEDQRPVGEIPNPDEIYRSGEPSADTSDTYTGGGISRAPQSQPQPQVQPQPQQQAQPQHREVISHAADTPIAPTSEPSTYHGSHEASSPAEARNLNSTRYSSSSSSSSTRSSSTSHTSSSSTSNRKRDKYDSASVDDLLAMIEEEKKKLDQ